MEQLSLIREAQSKLHSEVVKSFTSEVKEKAAIYGPETLSNRELVMLLVQNIDKADRLCKNGLKSLEEMSMYELKEILTESKAIQIKAALELGKRIRTFKGESYKISSPKDASDLLMEELRYLKQEILVVVYLNTKNIVLGKDVVSKGSLNSSIVHPREVFKDAIKRSAGSIIVAHNHPSGDPTPSKEDINITGRLKECGKLIGIELLDHIIIGDGNYISLKEKGVI